MIDDVKGNASTKPHDHDIASLGILKFTAGFESVLFQNGRDIRAALNRGKAMVRNDDEVGLLGELAIIQSLPDFIEVAVAIFNRSQRCIRADPGFVLRAAAHGHPTYCWTVDEPTQVALCAELGVTYLATNRPATALRQLAAS